MEIKIFGVNYALKEEKKKRIIYAHSLEDTGFAAYQIEELKEMLKKNHYPKIEIVNNESQLPQNSLARAVFLRHKDKLDNSGLEETIVSNNQYREFL